MTAVAAVAPVPTHAVRNVVVLQSRIRRRFLVLGSTAALSLSAPVLSARAEVPVKLDAPVKTTDYKGFNLFGEGSAERCENGQGAACDKLADGSELILQLQEQSRANKEKRARGSGEGTWHAA